MNYLELFGILSSVIIFISLSMTSIVKLRWINTFGCILFSVYGYMIGSLSTMFLNAGIAILNLYFLRKMYSFKDEYILVKAEKETSYYKFFMEKHISDIKNFFTYSDKKDTSSKTAEEYFLIRNNNTAGLVSFFAEENAAVVNVDYVTPEYRDMKFGAYLYSSQCDFFQKLGYKKIVQLSNNPAHIGYLKKIGFVESAPGRFEKAI